MGPIAVPRRHGMAALSGHARGKAWPQPHPTPATPWFPMNRVVLLPSPKPVNEHCGGNRRGTGPSPTDPADNSGTTLLAVPGSPTLPGFSPTGSTGPIINFYLHKKNTRKSWRRRQRTMRGANTRSGPACPGNFRAKTQKFAAELKSKTLCLCGSSKQGAGAYVSPAARTWRCPCRRRYKA